MRANELRIGNWVYSTLLERPFQIDLKTLSSYPRCEPIPLTEKWLGDFGFDSIQRDPSNCNVNYTNSTNPQYWVQHHTEVNDWVFYGPSNSIEVSLKYVHQLQNLYFALTQTELKTK